MDAVKASGTSGQRPTLLETSRNREIIEQFTSCCLCGGPLEFNHSTNYVHLVVREEAACPACGVRTKTETHRLQ